MKYIASQKEFWNERVQKYQHTGWADPVIYAFDQRARLRTIKELIEKKGLSGRNAFDFGCGTGDFTRMLADYFDHVTGFDVSEKVIEQAQRKSKKFANISFYTGDTKEINIKEKSLDLILCITVLDHLKEEGMLTETINYFSRKLSPQGSLIGMEYAPDKKTENNSYQRMDTFSEWKKRFHEAGLYLTECYGFFHPDQSPSKKFLKYKKDLRTIFLTSLKKVPFTLKYLDKIAAQYVDSVDDLLIKSREDVHLRIMIFKKV